jgi:hypothetical protein
MSARLDRIARGVAAGVLTPLAIIATLVTLDVLSWDEDQPSWPRQGLFDVMMGTAYASVPLAVSFALGAPLWAWLRHVGSRNAVTAALTGGASGAAAFLIVGTQLAGFPFLDALPAAGAYALLGALSWFVGWWVMRPWKSDENAWET